MRWWRLRVLPGRPRGRRFVSTTLWWSCRRSRRRSWCSRNWPSCRKSRQRGRAGSPADARRLFPIFLPSSRPSPGKEREQHLHHAAEESCLRWLHAFKKASGSSKSSKSLDHLKDKYMQDRMRLKSKLTALGWDNKRLLILYSKAQHHQCIYTKRIIITVEETNASNCTKRSSLWCQTAF